MLCSSLEAAKWNYTHLYSSLFILFVSPSCSYASTTSGWPPTPRAFWSWSPETLRWTSWSAPSSSFAWLMRFPSSPTTWPRWSSPKTTWPCWSGWGPWGSSLWESCCCPGAATKHPAPDGNMSWWFGAGEDSPSPFLRLKGGPVPRREPARCYSLPRATGRDLSCIKWQHRGPWEDGGLSRELYDCCESRTLNNKKRGKMRGERNVTKKKKNTQRLHYLDLWEEQRRKLMWDFM